MGTILVTGGAGYIGSHCVCKLLEKNRDVIVVDNFSNSYESQIQSIRSISNRDFKFYNLDLNDIKSLESLFGENKIESVIHFAADKSVPKSLEDPLSFYGNNILTSLYLFQAMRANNVNNIIFSSSATIYSESNAMPLLEMGSNIAPNNPYGKSKLFIEEILRDLSLYSGLSVGILRYFNPLGAHVSGYLGEQSRQSLDNLGPALFNSKKNGYFDIYGNDYDTEDGTPIRDFIHVMDLAEGHINALDFITDTSKYEVWNLGSGVGYSILEVVKKFMFVVNKDIKINFSSRRPGDIPISLANIDKAQKDLGWIPKLGLEDMLIDLNRWDELKK